MNAKAKPTAVVSTNRRAAHKFELVESIECGLMLRGTEVKSVREKHVSLEEAYARIEGDELWLIGCHIATYANAHRNNHEPLARRKLLVSKAQLRKLKSRVEQKGMTLVPLDVHFNERGLAKVTLCLAQGKGHADRRETLKLKEHKREMQRAMKPRGG